MRLHRAPHPICPSPSPDAAAGIQTLMAMVESSSRSRQAPLKALCLRRDGYRCALSGAPDKKSVVDGRISREDRRLAATMCAHIIPFALRKLDENDELEVRGPVLLSYHSRQCADLHLPLGIQVEKKATIWWAFYRYFPALNGLISPNTVNQPGNAFTADPNIHEMFDSMDFALEPSVRSRASPSTITRPPHIGRNFGR